MDKPLVSVVVITYNSSKFVYETLESVKNQTYKNIELIISDDCSTDNTLDICENWVNKNATKFANCKILKANNNGGTAFNLNKGLKETAGFLVKGIAGDDILLPNCINEYIQFFENNANAKIAFSNNIKIDDSGNQIGERLQSKKFFSLTAEKQFKELLKSNIVSAPSIIFHRDIIIDTLYDERFPLIEDYPLLLKMTKMGIKLHLVVNFTVAHRIHENSIMYKVGKNNKDKITTNYESDFFNFKKTFLIPELERNKMYLYLLSNKIDVLLTEHRIKKTKYLKYAKLLKLFDLIMYTKLYKRVINRIKFHLKYGLKVNH